MRPGAASDYEPGDYPPFAVTVDVAVFTIRRGALQVLLIERGGKPFPGALALPGGFVRPDEDLDRAAARELAEETGLREGSWHLEQLAAYGAPGRDPRMRVVTVAYVAVCADLPAVRGGGDAAAAVLTPVEEIERGRVRLAFDHDRIVTDALKRTRSGLEHSTLAARFCPPVFTAGQLRRVYEAVWNTRLDAGNFLRNVRESRAFEERPPATPSDRGRPASRWTAAGARLVVPLLRALARRPPGRSPGSRFPVTGSAADSPPGAAGRPHDPDGPERRRAVEGTRADRAGVGPGGEADGPERRRAVEGTAPVTRGGYLRDPAVERFIGWLRPLVRGDAPFRHEYWMLRPVRRWCCDSLWDAFRNYEWHGSFEARQETLDRLAGDLRRAVARGDGDGFLEAALATLRWGGVTAHNAATLHELGGNALPAFRDDARLLDPSRADTSRLDGVRRMNSGWTKVHALLLDDFPTYDGRVGAALGHLVRLHCTEAGLPRVPEPLRFRWHPGQGGHDRNPSVGALRFPMLSAAAPRRWAECNVRAAWVLGAVRDEGGFGALPPHRRLRALEAALFMIGYELPTPE